LGTSYKLAPAEPDAPHVGWQVGKKTSKKVGHILLDDVPAGRPKKKDSNCSL
jgi:hypothetical protein